MANFSHVEPINQYSWWGSHITPYNTRWIHENLKGCTLSSFSHARSSFLCCPSSHAIPKLLTPAKFVHCNTRWIHENLKGMDVKVKAMLKLIEEDGDSFARRAEMYYKRRPELKKLVEEFDGGYRALSERYEHSTKALRQVHRTLAEALPNQMPPLSSEESQYGLSDTEMEPHTSEFPLPVRHLFGSKEKQKDDLSSTKTLMQYSEVLAPGEVYENKAQDWDQGAIVKKESSNVIKNLQQDITQLSSEIHVLKDQLIKESKRANNAESEVQSLRRSLSKLSSENDAALLQYQASIEKISGLELLLSRTQRDLEKISNDMVKEANKLKIAEQLNQSLQLGLDTLEQKTKVQELEIIQKQEDLEKLQATIQGKFHQFLEAEVALLSYKKRYFQSEEEAKHLDLEVQKGIAKLRNVEEGNRALEEEICKVREENSNLSEQILRFTLTMEGLEGKIIILNANKRKVEDEQRILLKEKEVLIQEIYCVKVDKNVLEQRYHELIDKMQAARKHTETLQAAIKELQNGNCELKEVCKEHEAEKELLVGKLTDMNKFSEKNTILERLLSDANTEVEVLREKVIALECTHESLKSEIYNYMSERDSLAVQLKDYMENIEMLVEKNTLLENSLSDSSREVENMKAKLKTLEDDSQSIRDQNFGLLSEKYALLMKVESVSTILENLEELRDVLQVEKQQHEDCILSYKNLLKNLENKISLLQEENQHMEKDLEIGEHNLIDALMENFILRRSLFNLKEGNLVLALEGKNYLEACRSAETQVSRLEQEKMVQMRQILSLTKHNEKISEKIHLLCKAINFNKAFKSAEEIQDEFLLELITSEIVKLIDYISHAEDNNQQLQLEISVLVTLLRHIKNDIVNLRLQKHSLESELEDKNCELITLANEKHELLGWNEQLTSSIEASKQREEALESDIKFLRMHVNGAQETLQTTQREITKLIEERENLSQEGCYLRRRYNILEEEHNEALAEAMKMNHLYLLFKSLDADRVNEVKCLCHELDSLQVTKNNFASEISRLYEKISMLEAEKMHSSDSITSLEEELKNRLLILECDLNFVTSLCEELNLQTETMENQLMEKQIQQSAANQRIKSTQEEKMRLNRLIEALNMENIESRLSKEEMREKISKFSEVVAEGGMSMMPNNMQLLTVNESLQDEKIDELLVEDEIISMVLKVTLVSELSLNKKIFEELKNKLHDMESKDKEQKADLDINLMMLKSLWNGVASLERQITSISKLEQLNSNAKDKETKSCIFHQPHSVNQPSENPRDMRTGGVLLEKLINKVESLQKVLSNNMSLLEKERLDLSSSLDLARKEIEMLKIIDIEARGALRMNNGSAKQLDAYPECPDFFKGKHGEIPKDIQLEQASSSFALREASSRRLSTRNSDFNDQSWECFEISHKFQTGKTSSITTGDCILSTEEEESYPSSSSRITKLSIDKLDVCKISLEHKQQWRKRLLERLNTDAQKLLDLKRSREEMIKKLRSHKDKLASNEFDSLKQHLEETQGAMLELIDANIRLKNMGKDFNPSDNRAIKDDDGDSTKRRQISELAKWESEKVGRLERKLRKIQHVLLKIEDEHENKHTRKRIILRDYFYGRENPRQKTLLCGCLQV